LQFFAQNAATVKTKQNKLRLHTFKKTETQFLIWQCARIYIWQIKFRQAEQKVHVSGVGLDGHHQSHAGKMTLIMDCDRGGKSSTTYRTHD